MTSSQVPAQPARKGSSCAIIARLSIGSSTVFQSLRSNPTWVSSSWSTAKFSTPSCTKAPMRFCTIAGFIISAVCILFSLLSVVLYLFDTSIAPRGTTTIIVALFFLSGIQLLFIGMLGEYITSIQAQVRGGPMVIEKELININKAASPTAPDTTGVA